MVVPLPGPPFDHLLHAHSHTLYFGWAGLAVWALVFSRHAPGRALARTVGATVAVLPLLFASFLAQGYGPASIAASTVMMLLWYAAVGLWWRVGRGGANDAFLRAAFAYVVVSSLGVWVLAGLQASGLGTPLAESLAVHAFLLGFARFFLLAVLGLLVERDLLAGAPLARLLPWWVALGWLTFPLGVAGGPEVPVLGPLARLAGLVLVVPTVAAARHLWRSRPDRWPAGWVGRWLGGTLVVTAVLEGVVAAGGTSVIVAGGRHGVVLYLHVFLLGFVTTALLALLGAGSRLLGVHVAGTALLLAGLAVAVAVPGPAGLAVAAG